MKNVLVAAALVFGAFLASSASAGEPSKYWACGTKDDGQLFCSAMSPKPVAPSGRSIGELVLNVQDTCRVMSDAEVFAWKLHHNEEKLVDCSVARGYITNNGFSQGSLFNILTQPEYSDVRVSASNPAGVIKQ